MQPSSGQLTDLQRQVEEKRQARLQAQEQARLAANRGAPRTAHLMGQRVSPDLWESLWTNEHEARGGGG